MKSLCVLALERGTSMATPIAAGNAALVQQYFQEGWYPTGVKTPTNSMQPSGALIKAVLLGETLQPCDLMHQIGSAAWACTGTAMYVLWLVAEGACEHHIQLAASQCNVRRGHVGLLSCQQACLHSCLD